MAKNESEDYLESLLKSAMNNDAKNSSSVEKTMMSMTDSAEDRGSFSDFLSDFDESFNDVDEERFLSDFEPDLGIDETVKKSVKAEPVSAPEPVSVSEPVEAEDDLPDIDALSELVGAVDEEALAEVYEEPELETYEEPELEVFAEPEADAFAEADDLNEELDQDDINALLGGLGDVMTDDEDVPVETGAVAEPADEGDKSLIEELGSDELLDLLGEDAGNLDLPEELDDEADLLGMLEGLGDEGGDADDSQLEAEVEAESLSDDFDIFEGLERSFVDDEDSELSGEGDLDAAMDALGVSDDSEEAEEEPKKGKKGKKDKKDKKGKKDKKEKGGDDEDGGLVGKLLGIFKKDKKDDAPKAEGSEDSEDEEGKEASEGKKGKKEKGKKEKGKKGKKEKGKKKEKKPKKEKAPKEPEPPQPPLPKLKTFLILLLAGSFIALFFLGNDYIGYEYTIHQSKISYDAGNFEDAFAELAGMTIKENDMEYYNQVFCMAKISRAYNSYESFVVAKQYAQSFDMLIDGVIEYNDNKDEAMELGVAKAYTNIYNNIIQKLRDIYNISEKEAKELAELKNFDRLDYSVKVRDIVEKFYPSTDKKKK